MRSLDASRRVYLACSRAAPPRWGRGYGATFCRILRLIIVAVAAALVFVDEIQTLKGLTYEVLKPLAGGFAR